MQCLTKVRKKKEQYKIGVGNMRGWRLGAKVLGWAGSKTGCFWFGCPVSYILNTAFIKKRGPDLLSDPHQETTAPIWHPVDSTGLCVGGSNCTSGPTVNYLQICKYFIQLFCPP